MDESFLLSVLTKLERQPRPSVVHFTDGEVSELRIVSTMHAEAGGDVVAEVMRTLTPGAWGGWPEGSLINFHLLDIGLIVLDGVCVYRQDGGI